MKWDHGLRFDFVRRAQTSRRTRLLVVLFIATTLIGTNDSLTVAQSTAGVPRRSGSRLSVDVVKLKSGKSMRGTIARADADGSLTMAVSRDWLRKADPKLLANVEAEEARTRVAALELRDRIKKELERVSEESAVAAFLRVERKRVDLLAESPQPEQPQFVWLELTAKN